MSKKDNKKNKNKTKWNKSYYDDQYYYHDNNNNFFDEKFDFPSDQNDFYDEYTNFNKKRNRKNYQEDEFENYDSHKNEYDERFFDPFNAPKKEKKLNDDEHFEKNNYEKYHKELSQKIFVSNQYDNQHQKLEKKSKRSKNDNRTKNFNYEDFDRRYDKKHHKKSKNKDFYDDRYDDRFDYRNDKYENPYRENQYFENDNRVDDFDHRDFDRKYDKKHHKKSKNKDFYDDRYDDRFDYRDDEYENPYRENQYFENDNRVGDFEYRDFDRKYDKKNHKKSKNKDFYDDRYDDRFDYRDDEYENSYRENQYFENDNRVDDFEYRDFDRRYNKKHHKKSRDKDFYDYRYDDLNRKEKYFEDEIEIDSFEKKFYDKKNHKNKNYDDDYLSDKNSKKETKGNKKKKTIFTIFISTIAVCFIIVAIVLLVFFLVNRNAPSPSSPRESISREYMVDKSETSKKAMNYISQRTFSMQFFYSNNQNSGSGKVINGTGWIFNKEKNNDIYYIATNVHVAAALNYGGKTFTENGEENDFSSLSLHSVSLGYVNMNGDSNIYDISDLNMIDYKKGTNFESPEIVYLPDASDSNSTFSSYDDYYLSLNDSSFQPVIDFAILKFDFSSLKSSNSDFANWLSIYDSNPTELASEPISLSNEDTFYDYARSTEFFMGGFPYMENNESSSNVGQTEWIGFSKFKTAINDNKNNDVITKDNYYKIASGAFQNSPSNKEALENNKIDYFQENKKVNYLNVGFYWLLAAKSAGGASGSMLVKETSTDSNKFEVVGIYWGTQNIRLENLEGFLTEAISGAPAVGVANMLNYTNYSTNGTREFGLDIFYDATQKIKENNNSTELLYQYVSKNTAIKNINNQDYITNLNIQKISNNFSNYSINLENSWKEINYKKFKKI